MEQRWAVPLVALWSLRAAMLSFVLTLLLSFLQVAPGDGAERVRHGALLWLTSYAALMVAQAAWWAVRRFFRTGH